MGRRSPCAAHWPEIQLWLRQGLTRRQIAECLTLSYHTVQAFLQRRHVPGVPKGTALKIDDTRLRELRAQGWTHARIAHALGVHETAIDRRCQRLGLPTARTGPRSGAGHPHWRDGRALDKHGYVKIWAPLHPLARLGGYVLEHRLVMEVVLGRYLTAREVPHHRDNHPWHNWPANLTLHPTNASHLRAELTGRVQATPRASIPGAYGNSQKMPQCPDTRETLAQCPSEIQTRLADYIVSHRPTTAQESLPLRVIRRSGAWRDPFPAASTD